MKVTELRDFINSGMRMQHIYQPVMIRTLLESGNRATVKTIAKQFLSRDESMLEYYMKITKEMPGKVLTRRGIVRYEPGSGIYILNLNRELTDKEYGEILDLCKQKIKKYEEMYGRRSIWHARFADAKYVSGSDRFEVLKKAKDRCELCGVSKNVRALEVDHIVPRNKGGLTVLENLQALCYTCNAQKQDKDSTDFRQWHTLYEARDKDCLFCNLEQTVKIKNSLAMAFEDNYPVTEGHMLISPLRHTPSFFDMGSSEHKACFMLLEQAKVQIAKRDLTVTGFNVGVNDGRDAGQTILHCHIHLIPRRKGDVTDPRGGIRHIVPGKGFY